jgi:hypothetical protein
MKRDDYFYINQQLYVNSQTGKKVELKKISKEEYHYKEYVIKRKSWQTIHWSDTKWKIYKNDREIISCYNLNNVKEYFKAIKK